MFKFTSKLNKLIFSSLIASVPFQNSVALASEILIANNYDEIEEVRVRRVNKKGNLVVKFCNKLKDYSGYVIADNQKFFIENADIIKPRKIVWKSTNLPKLKKNKISVENLLARYSEDDIQVPLRVVDDGECGVGILPFILIGAGIAAGAGSGGSGSSSSN